MLEYSILRRFFRLPVVEFDKQPTEQVVIQGELTVSTTRTIAGPTVQTNSCGAPPSDEDGRRATPKVAPQPGFAPAR